MPTSNDTSRHQTPWWDHFFDDEYAAYGLSDLADDEKVKETVDFLCSALSLENGSILFDQCCGVGRLSIPLAQRGIHIVGVDITDSYIDTATQRAESENVQCDFHVGDAHKFVSPRLCDAAINWFTSFGYEEDDVRNRLVLQRAFDSLKPGGLFAMDYMNIPKIMATYRQWFIDRRSTDDENDLIVLHEPELDLHRGMIRATWTYIYPDGQRVEKNLAVRMYMPHELVKMLELCGFSDVTLYGSFEKDPLNRQSSRCIVVATKPQ